MRRLDSRAVVRMASGAALYGVLSLLTNVLPLPSASFVSMRPAIVIPIFFGWYWGPRVGFFAGCVGNLIGDALTGWGFSPTWCLGNGVLGAVPGLALLSGRWLRSANVLAPLAAAAFLALAALMRSREGEIAGVVPAELYLWPLLPAGLVLATWLVALRSRATAPAVLWGLFGLLAGIGTAALLDVPYSGMSPEATLIGQFVPATLANAVLLVVLYPPLVRAYERALDRAGR